VVQTQQKTECFFIPTVTSNSIAKVYTWRNRVLQRALERLELLDAKVSRAVLRGRDGGNTILLPDTGKLRSTPVSVLVVDGRRYIVTGSEMNWVKNVRAAGRGFLTRGGKKERVALVELPVEERPPILREFPRQVPHGVEYFERLLGLPNDPEAFAEAAPRCPVFRVESVSEAPMKEVANSSVS